MQRCYDMKYSEFTLCQIIQHKTNKRKHLEQVNVQVGNVLTSI